MEPLSIDQLLRIIESIVFRGPITLEGLKAQLKYTIGYVPHTETIDVIILGLIDKYAIHFYGIEFSNENDRLQFKSRTIQEIVNN